jgi:hypothetical protein
MLTCRWSVRRAGVEIPKIQDFERVRSVRQGPLLAGNMAQHMLSIFFFWSPSHGGVRL